MAWTTMNINGKILPLASGMAVTAEHLESRVTTV